MTTAQDRWDAVEARYKAERDTPVMAQNRAYTEAFRDGMRAAIGPTALTRPAANARAAAMPVRQGDAFLAGYYTELRRLRNYEDLER